MNDVYWSANRVGFDFLFFRLLADVSFTGRFNKVTACVCRVALVRILRRGSLRHRPSRIKQGSATKEKNSLGRKDATSYIIQTPFTNI